MISIFRKEVNAFLSSLVGYVAITIFLVANGLLCWVFTDTSVFDNGFANLDPLFTFAPWVFLILIPAITMRSFAEEINTGTIELLLTRPITDIKLVLGKYFAAIFLVFFSILPTILYYYAIHDLSSPVGNVDKGGIIGSYIGLFLLGSTFAVIGICASAMSSNPIIAFISAMFLCFFLYTGFDSIAQLPLFEGRMEHVLSQLSINEHYRAISKGVIDTRDLVYFGSMIVFFIMLTKTLIESRKW